MRSGNWTPWGPAQTVRDLGRGCFRVTTAGHGGIAVPAWLWAAEAPEALRSELPGYSFRTSAFLWFEEDCDAAVALVLPHVREALPITMEEARAWASTGLAYSPAHRAAVLAALGDA